MVKIIGEIYKKGNSTVVETVSKPSTEIVSGLAVEITGGVPAMVSSGVAYAVSGRNTEKTMDLIRTGLEVCVQVDDETIAIGDPVYINKTTHKFTNESTNNTAVNAVFVSAKEDCDLVATNGSVSSVKGALIDIAGGL